MRVSKEDLAKARQMDLLTYLQQTDPNELVHKTGSVYCTREHDSLKISNGKWYWWSRGFGGRSALDYLTMVQGLSLQEAVQKILGTEPPSHTEKHTELKEEKVGFCLPQRHVDNRRVFSYLAGRGIAPEIINHCIKSGQLYEDAQRHNCVFVGFNEAREPCYAALRGTISEKRFIGEVTGSDKRYSFAVPLKANGQTVCLFESAIDALSYLTMMELHERDWRGANVLSLGGIYKMGRIPAALEQYLKDNPQVRRIVLCLDNDEPGRAAAASLREALRDYDVIDNAPKRGKDWNESLQLTRRAREQRER